MITRTIWIVATPGGTQAIRSLFGTPSSSSRTRKPSAKPSTQPRQVASRWMRAASLFPSLSMLEQISEKSRPDRLISGCSAALFGPVLAGEQTKKIASTAGTRSRRTASSDPLRDSTSDLGYSTNTLAGGRPSCNEGGSHPCGLRVRILPFPPLSNSPPANSNHWHTSENPLLQVLSLPHLHSDVPMHILHPGWVFGTRE